VEKKSVLVRLALLVGVVLLLAAMMWTGVFIGKRLLRYKGLMFAGCTFAGVVIEVVRDTVGAPSPPIGGLPSPLVLMLALGFGTELGAYLDTRPYRPRPAPPSLDDGSEDSTE
jgi:hypothetical protein